MLVPRPHPNINTHPRGVTKIPCPSLLTQGICLLLGLCLFSKVQAMCRAVTMGAGSLDQSLLHDSWGLWGGELVPTQQASNAQGCTTHLVSSPLTQGWVLMPLCPFVGCSVPASTIHVEGLVTDAVQALTSSRGSPPPRTAPMSASVRMPR